jgi:hypothetical protein
MDIVANRKCYDFLFLYNKNSLFDDTIDCTYIIHLENNGRLKNIYDQMEEYKLTKTVCILVNKGFKNCNKVLLEQKPFQDLTDAFLQCFENAKRNGFKNIIVLEDDFFFHPEIKQGHHIQNINHFLQRNKGEEFIYHLGVIPIVSYPHYDLYTYHSVKSLTMHSAIYSEELIRNSDRLLLEHKHWDVIIEKSVKNRYFYYKPLCYQLFPETENKKTWSEKDSTPLIGAVKNNVIQLLSLDTTHEPGFTILYYFSKGLFLLFLLCLIIITFSILKSAYSYRGVVMNKKRKSK